MQRSDTTFRPGAQGREWDEMVKRVVADNRRNVLDWGAGYGQVTARLIVRGVAVTSYEFRPDVPTGVAQFDSFPSLRYDHSPDPVRLPYLDETFDAVLSSGVLEHVSNPEQSLEEIRRVLQPGGRLYVYKLPNESSWLEWIARRAGMDYHGMPERPYDRLYTVESARALVAAHGFRVVEARLANILPLTVGPYRSRPIAVVWRANRALGRVPGLRRLATNVQVIAERA